MSDKDKFEEKLGLLSAASVNLTVQIRLAVQQGEIKLNDKLRKALFAVEKILIEVNK